MKKFISLFLLIILLCGCGNEIDTNINTDITDSIDEIIIDNGINPLSSSIDINHENDEEVISKWFNLPLNVFYHVKVKFTDNTYWNQDIYKIKNDILENSEITNEITNFYQNNIYYYKYKNNNIWDQYIFKNDKWELFKKDVNYPIRSNSNEVIMFKSNLSFIDTLDKMKVDEIEYPLNISFNNKDIYYYSKDFGFNLKLVSTKFQWSITSLIKDNKDYPVDISYFK